MVPIESSLREEFFYNLPRSGKLDFAKFSGGKLRAHPGKFYGKSPCDEKQRSQLLLVRSSLPLRA